MTLQEFFDAWRDGNDYILAHTSGSTGKPKDIRLLKSDMVASARLTNEYFGINGKSKLGIPLSLDYIAGKMMVVRAIIAGCEIDIIPPSNDFSVDTHFDLFSIVPSQTQCLLQHSSWTDKLRNIIIGGASLSLKTSSVISRCGYNAYCSYGMTETCSHVALSKVTGEKEAFEAMPGISFKCDERGCLVIDAPNFSFGLLTTNDIVDLVDRRHFHWRGRYDNVINSGGIKFYPEELEEEYSKYIDMPFYVVGVPDEVWGTRIEIVCEGDAKNAEIVLETLRKSIDSKRLPKNIRFVSQLPRTSNGKIKRVIVD